MTDGVARDEGGWQALVRGAECYDAGMSCIDAAEREDRIAWFRKAERWYLEAAEAGNPYAWMDLGYVYSYDRCAGAYRPLPGAQPGEPYPRERRAFECFEHAARMGLAEACYKLGDLYSRGVGCMADAQWAYAWYTRAADRAGGDPPYVWGSAALRLADAHEHGRGCEQDFKQALSWYRKAVSGLQIAVRDGDWFYERPLSRAKAGVKRMCQELQDC